MTETILGIYESPMNIIITRSEFPTEISPAIVICFTVCCLSLPRNFQDKNIRGISRGKCFSWQAQNSDNEKSRKSFSGCKFLAQVHCELDKLNCFLLLPIEYEIQFKTHTRTSPHNSTRILMRWITSRVLRLNELNIPEQMFTRLSFTLNSHGTCLIGVKIIPSEYTF